MPRPRNSAFLLELLDEISEEEKSVQKKRAAAEQQILVSQEKMGRVDDKKKHCPPVFKEGDYVLLKNHAPADGTIQKLKPRFKGPYMVKERVGNRYRVVNCPNERWYESLHAAEHMWPYQTTNDDSESDGLVSNNEEDR